MSFLTTPKSILVLSVIAAPGAGVEVQTTQLRSSICIRPLPVRSVEPLYQIASPVSDWMASCAPCKSFPIRFGIVQLSAEADDASPTDAQASVTKVAPVI